MPQTMLLAKIEQELASFPAAETKVANYVLKHPELVPTMTTKQLAEQANASQSSIVRFCKRLGLESFPKLKLALAKELTRKEAYINSASLLETDDSPPILFQKVSSLNQMALDMATKAMNEQAFTEAVEQMVKAKKIAFFGVGGSFTSCIDGQYKFMRLGFHSLASGDYHQMIPFITMMDEQDVVICMSTSGNTKEVLDIADYAKERNVKLIGITASSRSALTRKAAVSLLIPDIEVQQRIGSIASRTSQLNVIDALYVSVFHRIGSDLLDAFDASRKKTEEKRK
ncbi:MurR/RpiR family transcriptional regulator [Halalkalibacterium halodurans]|uniref:Transcriptional regulator (Hex regulon repressor) n=2 Tax=Halalkalibacterium halodurans TaxID=86665 RepID=Q9K6Z8_HALH5|nr:MurR/RpiR family transcriptional regulator [Halalkalibacterium halodurans]MED3648716.1 MurR/RpiR family transcriptional regulator [Halalkalibacterium halodurans]MED4083039.1 MurR/RpiR family transcriptional regulator [Halalkalibacterium halodurans]MED4087199.1 MurR/RpiR family transcriptional regulator [Halalkalibacterium halodurans]MED4106687.1 MurR/RpiR family transcriptional regulator [Halalkalibacterium halodurans]MED4111154.1 MurR/RpiR family transcriptional regulator [Halalkalibacteri